MSKKEKRYLNTTVPQDLIQSFKVLAVKNEVRINALLKEAIEDLLNKYKKKYKKDI